MAVQESGPTLRRGLTAVGLAVLVLVSAGCIYPSDPPGGAGIYVVNESGFDLVFEHRGRRLPVDVGDSVTVWFGSSDDRRECATDIRVVTADGTAEAWRDAICEDETWTVRAEDLDPVEP